MLDCVDLEVAPQPDGRPPRLNTVIERCKAMWESFKSFNRDAIVATTTHVLTVVRSHYPSIDLQAIGAGFAEGMGEVEHQQLEDEVEARRRSWPVTSTCSVKQTSMTKLGDLLGEYAVITE